MHVGVDAYGLLTKPMSQNEIRALPTDTVECDKSFKGVRDFPVVLDDQSIGYEP